MREETGIILNLLSDVPAHVETAISVAQELFHMNLVVFLLRYYF